jgi:hypothetical protein
MQAGKVITGKKGESVKTDKGIGDTHGDHLSARKGN